jgi:hypothetical protein
LIYNLIDGGSNVVATNSDGNFTGVALGIYTVEVDDAMFVDLYLLDLFLFRNRRYLILLIQLLI